jgi:aspartyl-tRNA(Asn)/glutamyl-tRNA(Gln) amidotransferase subunit B
LASIVDGIVADNPDAVADYRAGDDKARKKKRGFLFGEVMRATDRKANPQLVNRLLDDRLS